MPRAAAEVRGPGSAVRAAGGPAPAAPAGPRGLRAGRSAGAEGGGRAGPRAAPGAGQGGWRPEGSREPAGSGAGLGRCGAGWDGAASPRRGSGSGVCRAGGAAGQQLPEYERHLKNKRRRRRQRSLLLEPGENFSVGFYHQRREISCLLKLFPLSCPSCRLLGFCFSFNSHCHLCYLYCSSGAKPVYCISSACAKFLLNVCAQLLGDSYLSANALRNS